MKTQNRYKHLTFAAFFFAATLSASSLFAQVKIGTNPTTIDVNNNLEVESATTGNKVSVHKITGKVTIADGSQGDSKILTSDANGVATWTAPLAQNTEVWVYARQTGSQALTANQTTILFPTEVYDRGSNFNPATGEITVPSAGIYQISTGVKKTTNAIPSAGDPNGSFIIVLYVMVNNVLHTVLYEDSWSSGIILPRASGALTLQLNAGDKVKIDLANGFSKFTVGQCYLTFLKLSN